MTTQDQQDEKESSDGSRDPDSDPTALPASLTYAPWERRNEMGALAALGQTLAFSLVRPVRFARALEVDAWATRGFRRWVDPLAYVASMLAAYSMAIVAHTAVTQPSLASLRLLPPLVAMAIGMIVAYSTVVHLILWALRSPRQSFGSTLRIVCYASGAGVLSLLPYVGSFLALGWSFVLLSVGVVSVHRTRWGVAVVAVSLPCLALIVFAFIQSRFILVEFFPP